MNRWIRPDTWWNAIEPRFGNPRVPIALLALAIAGALGVAVACEIGVRHFNTDWNERFGYQVQRNRTWAPFFSLWVGFTITPIVQGIVAVLLLKLYSLPRRWLPGIALAIIGYVPMYAAAWALIFLPGILVFAIAFVISCGWWANGNRRLLGLKDSESIEHVAVSLAVSGVLMLLLFAALPP